MAEALEESPNGPLLGSSISGTPPSRRVGPGWIALISLANLGFMVGLYGPLEVLLPNQAQAIAGTAHDVVALGWVTGLGAVAAMLTQPIVGALSDRTASRLGRRHPWTLYGALVAAAALALLAGQHTIAGVAVCWCVVQAALNSVQAAVTAGVPDLVPVPQRGVVSGWVSLQQALGVVVAVALVTLFVTGNAGGYLATAVAVLAFCIPFVAFTRDPRLGRADRPPFRWREFAGSFWISPRRHPDFAWAWGTRFLVFLADSMAILYLLYFLQDKIHYARLFPGQTDEDGLFILIIAYTVGVLLSAVVGGMISDRSGRRKPLVTISGLIMAVPAVVLAFWPTWPVTVGCAVLIGVGFGAYLSVDLALVTQVLPSRAGYAKDLGVINIASAGPQVIAPVLAAPIVSSAGGYPALFLTVAAICVIGSVLVWKIRSVP